MVREMKKGDKKCVQKHKFFFQPLQFYFFTVESLERVVGCLLL